MDTTSAGRGTGDIEAPLCSVVIVNFNGRDHLERCVAAFAKQTHPRIEIIVVDNGSDDGSQLGVSALPGAPRLIENPVNGFAAALNLGVAHARGDYVVFANNDVFPDPTWAQHLIAAMDAAPAVGCAGGKLLFEDGRINSVGHRALPDFYFEDEGFGEEDRGQYEQMCETDGVCWAAVMFKRRCLDELLPIDEDYVLYYEDVDTSLRCRRAGWKILYVPRARARHKFHGSSTGTHFTEWFCDRSRLIFLAKFHPQALAAAIESSRFIERGEFDSLMHSAIVALVKLFECHPKAVCEAVLPAVRAAVTSSLGALACEHMLRRVQVIRGERPLSVMFYDHAMHLVGGGQRYGLEMAAHVAKRHDVVLLANASVSREQLELWYDLDLSRCQLEEVALPFFDDKGGTPDANLVSTTDENPFEAVAAASMAADVFVNVNMQPLVRPLSPFSIFLCHFPDIQRRDRFAVDDYSCVLTNSEYTTEWTHVRWGIRAHAVLYPPVAMSAPVAAKERLILSVARFEAGGSKKQHALVHAFERLLREHPEASAGWRLVLAGGSIDDNPYRERVQRLVNGSSAPIELRLNLGAGEIRDLYARASIFWHACGLGEDDPHLIEHFGMTTVEAMQNGCVPIVFDGGGLREIVEHGRSGYRFSTAKELVERTATALGSEAALLATGETARRRAERFSRAAFVEFVEALMSRLEQAYGEKPRPDPRNVLQGRLPTELFYCKAARRRDALPARDGSAPSASSMPRLGALLERAGAARGWVRQRIRAKRRRT